MRRFAVALALAGCTAGIIEPAAPKEPPEAAVQAPAMPGFVGATGFRRLTRNEYDNTLRDLLGDTTRPGYAVLPEDAADPFDNDYRTQQISKNLVEGVESLAIDAAARLVADPVRLAAVLPCTPKNDADAACLATFVKTFGRRALRRPLNDEDIGRYTGLAAQVAGADPFSARVQVIVSAMLQDPEFLYRTEVGTKVEGQKNLFKLTPFELATRLSFFLLGTTPPDRLLDRAASGKLETADDVRAAANELLDDERAKTQVDRFHALWLGYAQLPHPAALTQLLREETAGLVKRTVFEGRDYFDLFTSGQTFLNDDLAVHYGLPAPGSSTFKWVDYGQSPRRGILSQGTVLSAGAKFDDTSPTLRGLFVRTRLLCEDAPKPPANVNVDEKPSSNTSRCKKERYAAHANVGSCYACHHNMDPIGFGLEAYDRAGRFRQTEPNAPECSIPGDGEVAGVGAFNGPAGLADLLVKSGKLESCVVRQVYRFAMGRREAADDEKTLAALTKGFKDTGRGFRGLMVELVASDAFRHRVEEE